MQYHELVLDLKEPVPVSAIAILAMVGPCTPRELYLYTGESSESVNDFHVALEIPKLRQWRTLDFPVQLHGLTFVLNMGFLTVRCCCQTGVRGTVLEAAIRGDARRPVMHDRQRRAPSARQARCVPHKNNNP